MKKYKILQVGKFYPIKGGVEKIEYSMMTGLSALGYSCDMLCAATSGCSKTIIIDRNAYLITLRTLMKVKATMISPRMVTTLRLICRNYDIVHVHHPDPMACLALWLSGYKGKVVLHWHSDIVKQKMLLKLYEPLQRWLIKRADIIVGTSPVYTSCSPFLRKVQHKIATVPIGVDCMKADLEQVRIIKNMFPGRKIIFALGRLVEYKGFEHLIDAAEMLTDDYVVLIGGHGPLADDLRKRIADKNLSGRVLMLGFISDESLPAYFAAASLFCLPSVCKTEAFGLVQVEAMSCGTPVVATTIPGSGVAWVNSHGCSGLNVPVGNAVQLAGAIKEIVSDDEVHRQYSENARKRYETLFSSKMMISNMIDIYNKVMNNEHVDNNGK